MKSVALHNLGCKVNSYEIDVMQQRLQESGYVIVPIFSLDLSKPIDLNIHAEDAIDEVLAALKPYII